MGPIYMYVCMYVSTCMYVYMFMYVCMCVGMYVCMYVYMYVYMYVCMYVYIYVNHWRMQDFTIGGTGKQFMIVCIAKAL